MCKRVPIEAFDFQWPIVVPVAKFLDRNGEWLPHGIDIVFDHFGLINGNVSVIFPAL